MSPMKEAYLHFSFYSQRDGSPESSIHFPRSHRWFSSFTHRESESLISSSGSALTLPQSGLVGGGVGRVCFLNQAYTRASLHPSHKGLPVLWAHDWSLNCNTQSPFSKSLARSTTSGFHCSWVCEKRLSRKEWPAGCPSLEKLMVPPPVRWSEFTSQLSDL